uniref:F-box/LRR-repeat protein 15-like leucin rich repeat domain-containing protein n=1 Tax=Timema monikensis TaxID=170555 RepID=A0A7R9E6J2_9NEOP|nr:unnamed protein product [Timema monikensis]
MLDDSPNCAQFFSTVKFGCYQSSPGCKHLRRCAVGLTLTFLSVTGRRVATVSMDCREERSQAAEKKKISLSRKQCSLVRLCSGLFGYKKHDTYPSWAGIQHRITSAGARKKRQVRLTWLAGVEASRGYPTIHPMNRHGLFQALFELELAGCNEITEAGLWACLTPRVVSLTLTDCINVADEAVGAVAQLLPSLYEFSLQAYHVTDAALGYFSPKQSNSLSILRLQSCWELTNHGVVNIVHSLPNLTVLSLSGCSKITDEGVELIAENLQKLRSLDLSWCPRITDAALEYIACDLNLLEELTLDRCVHVTDIGVGYISTMLSLSALFLRWCSQVRDFGLQHLCGMRNLQVLSLAGCPLLTSSGLSSLIQLRHLQELELTNCPGASRELFEYLREHLPRCLVIE